MCGIAGMFFFGDEDASAYESTALRMIQALKHRGPDDGGLMIGSRILLGHRRLSILDPTPLGHQPMRDANGNLWIAFNGEIYNFRELRAQLEGLGHRFRSQTDTEVVLQAFRQWGRDAFRRFNGMFAIALWDRRDERLWLVRDPIGIKPMFFQIDRGVLRFGSEIKAILADPNSRRQPDLPALDAFFSFGYMPAPLTGFDGIRQLLPGQCLVAEPSSWRTEHCCEITYPEEAHDLDERNAVAGLRQHIDAAVVRQMVSDVPLGALLSGGLDSSAVVRSMQARHDLATKTFTIGFDEPSFDESGDAQRVADLLRTDHNVQHVTPAVATLLPTLISHAEEPLADNSMIPFFLLSQFARERVSVALSGDGADELLAGYSTYRATRVAPYYRAIPRLLRQGVIAPAVRGLPPSTRKYGWSKLLGRFVDGADQPFPRDHSSWRQILSPRLKSKLYTASFQQRTTGSDPIAMYAAAIGESPASASRLNRQLYGDLRFHLPNDILLKTDRMSMAHSLEVRVPLLDLELVRYCLSLPAKFKLRGGTGKYLLRQCLAETFPDDVVRRAKLGFVAPIETWMRGPFQPLLHEYLGDQFLRQSHIFRSGAIDKLIAMHARGVRNYAYELFALLVWAIWWRIWIDQSLPVSCVSRPAAPVLVQRRERESPV